MSTETNKAIVQNYFEQVWNNGRLEQIEEYFTEDVVEHSIPQIPGLNGRDTLKAVIGAAIYRLADGKIAEIWNFPDNLSLMQQLGIVPMPEAA